MKSLHRSAIVAASLILSLGLVEKLNAQRNVVEKQVLQIGLIMFRENVKFEP